MHTGSLVVDEVAHISRVVGRGRPTFSWFCLAPDIANDGSEKWLIDIIDHGLRLQRSAEFLILQFRGGVSSLPLAAIYTK